MADIQLIKKEIERRIKEGSSKNDISEGALALDSLLDFIDSLPEENHFEDKSEMVSEGLEEAAKQHSKQVFHGLLVEDNIIAFKAGAEWQKQRDQETIELAEDHAMLAGMNKMKEEMMKDAVEGEYWDGSIYLDNRPTEYKDGDKVKIIIVKEE